MKTLLIMRHGKSSWDNTNLADHDRPLNKRGKADVPRMGRLLLQEDLIPELIISSSAERALSTAEAVALACDYEEEILITREFYHADPDIFVEGLRSWGAENDPVLIVGHNPGLEDLVEELTGKWLHMTTATIAKILIPIVSWQEMDLDSTVGELDDLWTPKDLT